MGALGSVLSRVDRTGVGFFMNDELGERILREIYETKADVKAFALALNALNTEVARMSVKVEALPNLQQAASEHDRRLAKVEADVASQEKNAQRTSELTRWVIALAVTSLFSIIAVAIQFFRMQKL